MSPKANNAIPAIPCGIFGLPTRSSLDGQRLFSARTGYDASIRASASSEVNTQTDDEPFGKAGSYSEFGTGSGQSTATTACNWAVGNGTILYSGSDEATAKATVTGPGSGDPQDPNQLASSAQIQFNIQHSATDSFRNNTPGYYNTKENLGVVHGVSYVDSGNWDAGTCDYRYSLNTGGNPGSVTFTFQTNLNATGSADQFGVDAGLDLRTSYFNVKLSSTGGIVAMDQNGNALQIKDSSGHVLTATEAKNFEGTPPTNRLLPRSLPVNKNAQISFTVTNIPDGAPLDVQYQSSLSTGFGGGAAGANLPPGVSTNNTTFNWSLKVQAN